MDRVTFVSSGRADYSLIHPVMTELSQDDSLIVDLIITGTHLTSTYGKTIKEITFPIKERVDVLMQSNNAVSTANAIGLGVIKFSECFIKRHPGLLFLVGDRFEILSAAIAAYCLGIPIIHAHAGEFTYGSQDNEFRDMISLMSQYFLTAHHEYTLRLLELKESRHMHIHTVGALAVDNILSTPIIDLQTLSQKMMVDLTSLPKYFLITIHPETNLDRQTNMEHLRELLEALKEFKGNYVFTFANQDHGGADINKTIVAFCKKYPQSRYIRTAGWENYISLMHHSVGILGNSSSGIIEAPYLGKRVLNVGNRQWGRVTDDLLISTVPFEKMTILKGMDKIMKAGDGPPSRIFGELGVSKKIAEVVKTICQSNK